MPWLLPNQSVPGQAQKRLLSEVGEERKCVRQERPTPRMNRKSDTWRAENLVNR